MEMFWSVALIAMLGVLGYAFLIELPRELIRGARENSPLYPIIFILCAIGMLSLGGLCAQFGSGY